MKILKKVVNAFSIFLNSLLEEKVNNYIILHIKYIIQFKSDQKFGNINKPYKLVQEYNFLAAYDQWIANQKNMSQKLDIEFTIINANDSFSQYSKEADQFLKEELERRGIKVIYNANIENLDKFQREITVTENNGQKFVQKYDNFYSIIPSKGHDFLINANLCNENGLLSVNKHTLQHTNNIFGFGDNVDIPTIRSFFGTQEQLNVVRNNVIRSLHNQSLNGIYNGYSKIPLYIGKNKLTFVTMNYFKNSKFNLLDKEGKHISYIRNFIYSHFYQYFNTAFYKFITWGKPYFIFPKTYDSGKEHKEAVHHSTKENQNETTQKMTPQFAVAAYPYASQYFAVVDKNRSTQNIFKSELTSQQQQDKEKQEKIRKSEQEQKKKEQQLKREQDEREQKQREEQHRQKLEQEEKENKKKQELQKQKEEQESKLRAQKLQEEESQKQKEEQSKVNQEETEEVEESSKESENASKEEGDKDGSKKRKPRAKKGKKE